MKKEIDEVWKDIPNYEGRYQISNFGNVKGRYGKVYKGTYISNSGYLMINLCKNYIREKKYIHRIVADAFIDNPNNFKEINHKDENKTNNRVDNLEWCSRKYNNNYGTCISRRANKNKKKVAQFDKNDNFIKQFNSGLEAEKETKIDNASISRCCYNKQQKAGGFKWRFVNE